MYLKFFNLNTKPFEISPDPRFLWLGEKHKEGFAILKYGIVTGKGFISLTGDVGTGKTTLLNALAKSFGDTYIFARIPDPSLEGLDFFNFAANAFEMDKRFRGKGDFLSELTTFLNNAHANNKEVILIVDEAQAIKQELLEEIRLISNIEKPEKKLINIIFAGQNDFNEILINNRALRNRLAVNYKIEPLTEIETQEYITHRLKTAGSEIRIFSSRAIHEIYSFSKGNPRQINIICDLALLHGYVAETVKIEPAIIKECVKRTAIPSIKTEPIAESQKIPTKIPREPNQEKPVRALSRSGNMTLHRIKTAFSRHKTAYLTSIPLIILISIIGLVYNSGSDNPSILKLKTYFDQAISRYAKPIYDKYVPAVEVSTPLQIEQKLKESAKNLEQEKSSQYRLNAELAAKTSQALDYQNKLENTKEQVAELENALTVKDRMLTQSEQRQQELGKNLEQAKNSKDKLNSELSTQAALVADLQKRLQAFGADQAAREALLQKSRQETALLQTQLKELNTQNTSSESRLENLQTAHKALAADFQELKNTKEQVAELENALAVKDRMLTQSEQRQQELGKNLEQAINSKDKLNSELSTQAALVADLQKRLETFRADQAALEDEYNKSMKRTAQLQAQVQQLKAKTSLSPVKPVAFDLLEKPTSEMELPQEETESPNPADIIDWVLKKKSE